MTIGSAVRDGQDIVEYAFEPLDTLIENDTAQVAAAAAGRRRVLAILNMTLGQQLFEQHDSGTMDAALRHLHVDDFLICCNQLGLQLSYFFGSKAERLLQQCAELRHRWVS